MFSNLVDDAVNTATPHASAPKPATAKWRCIHDDGPGLPAEALEAVFTPFLRLETSRSRETGGAGLGLTIACALAEKDHVTLLLRNHPAGGLQAAVRWTTRPWGGAKR